MVDFSKPGWRTFWRDKENGDDVFLNESLCIVGVDLSECCSSHEKGTFCRRCMPRAVAAIEAARRALDPEAPAHVRSVSTQEQWPRRAALYNEINEKAFVMRATRAKRVTMLKTIISGDSMADPVGRVYAGKYVHSTRVCDAEMVRGFFMRLLDAPKDYVNRFRNAKVLVLIDGEQVVHAPFSDFENGPIARLVKPPKSKGCLFQAFEVPDATEPLGVPQKLPSGSTWMGYFIPNGTIFEVILKNVPGGGGTVQFESAWNLGTYTSNQKSEAAGA